eukprot:CAMPEP_0176057730 /NCGR_PEP_ID=MMETSP0120_2-20121206/28756_1 /TAXON_ID=160619 /ORGANISM="Kryptoperidinium foliaceum, Strain CCMP 1326" /LENGTH=382 /DNA_ID=CAMNT_0017391245 /DNA_START=57 /DNA_END=1205 /DNA_ORIENTATION=-
MSPPSAAYFADVQFAGACPQTDTCCQPCMRPNYAAASASMSSVASASEASPPQVEPLQFLPFGAEQDRGCIGNRGEATFPADGMLCQPMLEDVLGSVWNLSRDREGCRRVQEALDIDDADIRGRVVAELRGHVWEALRCPHANHVIQKWISVSAPEESQFIIDEIMSHGHGGVTQAARHRFGCRIIERLLEHCRAPQIDAIVCEIINDSTALSSHPYGNYVVQHVLEHGPPCAKRQLAEHIGRCLPNLRFDGSMGAVVAKALACGEIECRLELARRVLAVPGLIRRMAPTRHGHIAVKLVLQLFEESPIEHAAACGALDYDMDTLKESRYGRFLVAYLLSDSSDARSQCLELTACATPSKCSAGKLNTSLTRIRAQRALGGA